MQNHAKWHKQCHQKFNNTKLERAKLKRQQEGEKIEGMMLRNLKYEKLHDELDPQNNSGASPATPKDYYKSIYFEAPDTVTNLLPIHLSKSDTRSPGTWSLIELMS